MPLLWFPGPRHCGRPLAFWQRTFLHPWRVHARQRSRGSRHRPDAGKLLRTNHPGCPWPGLHTNATFFLFYSAHVIFYLWKHSKAPVNSLLLLPALSSCVACGLWTKIQRRCCLLHIVITTQRDVYQSRNMQHTHNIRRERRNKNNKSGESSEIACMCSICCKILQISERSRKTGVEKTLDLYETFWDTVGDKNVSVYQNSS